MLRSRIRIIWALSAIAFAAGGYSLSAQSAAVAATTDCEYNVCNLDSGNCEYVAPAAYNCAEIPGSCSSSSCNVS